MQIKVDFRCRDSILAAPIVLDLVLFMDLAKRSATLRGICIQAWLSFYFKSPMTAGEEMITRLGLDYYDSFQSQEHDYARIR